jgi:hypothetical protein
MPDIEPVKSDGDGVSASTVIAGVVGILVLVLLGVAIWLLIRNPSDTEVAATPSTVTSTTLPPPPTITGEFAIETSFDTPTAVLFRPGGELVEGTPCAGIDDGADVESGARMMVTDQNGTLVGTGALGGGVLALDPDIEDHTVPPGSATQRKNSVYAIADCVFEFSIPLSNEAAFYTVAVGDRSGLTYSHLEMVNSGWSIELGR